MSGLVGNPFLIKSQGGYQVSRSLRFNSSDSAYLSRTPASAGNRRTFTWSGWVKLGTNFGSRRMLFGGGTVANSIPNTYLEITDSAQLGLDSVDPPSFSTAARVRTTAVLRDPSAWYHVVFSIDTTQATTANRIKIYINGTEQTSYSSTTYPSQNYDTGINSTQIQTIGAYPEAAYRSGLYFDGYLADIYFIDGQALTPSSFTEVSATTGQLIPKKYTGTFGTNGFWLQFADNSNNTATTLGKDTSGNGNNWTPTNFSVAAGAGNDSLTDTPTSYGTDTGAGGEVRGNYATWNPLDQTLSPGTISNGNLDVTASAADKWGLATIWLPSSGKYYAEFTVTSGTYGEAWAGVYASSARIVYKLNGRVENASGLITTVATYTTNDVISIAVNIDANTITFYKNGSQVYSGSYTFTSDARYAVYARDVTWSANYGQRSYQTAAPAGFKALCDTNLPTPVVAKPNTVMDVLTWTGTGGNRTFTGLGFSPDLVWGKGRNAAYNHQLYDVVRGTGSSKDLASNLTNAEGSAGVGAAVFGYISAFNSDGFSTTGGSSDNSYWNGSSTTYVAWCWDAGTTTSSNVAGSITSSVRANTSAGFSIVSWTGNGATNATVGHGLGVTPAMIIAKNRNTANNWAIWFSGFTANEYMIFTTAAKLTYSTQWGSTPTSTVFGVADGSVNGNGNSIIAYCFAPVVGYSSFGSYVGNGSADGVFQWCGFRPRWLLIKSSSGATENWVLIDSARDTYNVAGTYLLPNLANAEGSSLPVDLLSNGFKLRGSGGTNQSAVTYVWAAFAESPFAYSRAR